MLRDQLSSLQGILVLSMLMTDHRSEEQIVQLAANAVTSIGRCRLAGIHLDDGGWRALAGPCTRADVRAALAVRCAELGSGGPVDLAGSVWGWAFPLRSLKGNFGHLIVMAEEEPDAHQTYLLRVFAQQVGVSLANAELHARERESATELRETNSVLAELVDTLESKTAIHDRLTQVALSGGGPEGVATAVHELTGFPVVVEDRFGTLLSAAGVQDPPAGSAIRQDAVIERVLREGRPIRAGARLVAVASPGADVLGVLSIVDPHGRAGAQELVALEHGATVLATELARLRALAETELRLSRDVVEELLLGSEDAGTLARARLLGYDAERPCRVVMIEGGGPGAATDDELVHTVRRATRALGIGALVVSRPGGAVLLTDAGGRWEELRSAVARGLGRGWCRLGVGTGADRPSGLPRSYREARLALRLHGAVPGGGDRALEYEELGVYQLLADVEDLTSVDRYTRKWLGPLLDYDAGKRADLVTTLSRFLECGGSYDTAATLLSVGRSTLRYRLQRIRDLSGHDLADPDTRFNLQLATRAWQTLLSLQVEPDRPAARRDA